MNLISSQRVGTSHVGAETREGGIALSGVAQGLAVQVLLLEVILVPGSGLGGRRT